MTDLLFFILKILLIPAYILLYLLEKGYNNNLQGVIILTMKLVIMTGIAVWLVEEVIYHLYMKRKMKNGYFNILMMSQMPNPWNYYIGDGISYLRKVSSNDSLDGKIRSQATRLSTEIELLGGFKNFIRANRLRHSFALALQKYADHFTDEYQTIPNDFSTHNSSVKPDVTRLEYIINIGSAYR